MTVCQTVIKVSDFNKVKVKKKLIKTFAVKIMLLQGALTKKPTFTGLGLLFRP